MYEVLVALAAFVLVYSVVAGRIERSWVSGPMIFVLFGVFLGPAGLGVLAFEDGRVPLGMLAELTLALVLFTDAAGADLGVLRRTAGLPVRLLLVGLPLTIALGFGVGWLMGVDLTVFEVALVATMLAPTDAALGKAVVSNEAVPDEMRQGLNVESGLNDGICVPILFLFLALAQNQAVDGGAWSLAVELVAEEIGIGLAVGLGVTFVGVHLMRFGAGRGWVTESWSQLPVVALALCCFGTAQLLGGSGFIASFTGGLLFGGLAQRHRHALLEAAEGTGDALALVTWVIFGATVIHLAIGGFSGKTLTYSVLSLTVIRMLPVVLSLTGVKLPMMDKLFIAWFGPRGLASIVFIIIVLDDELPHGSSMAMVVACTVILSIIGHGITANPWASVYRDRTRSGASS
jgi:NhaP-type Na+/H+ or K+/H+ antiporter